MRVGTPRVWHNTDTIPEDWMDQGDGRGGLNEDCQQAFSRLPPEVQSRVLTDFTWGTKTWSYAGRFIAFARTTYRNYLLGLQKHMIMENWENSRISRRSSDPPPPPRVARKGESFGWVPHAREPLARFCPRPANLT